MTVFYYQLAIVIIISLTGVLDNYYWGYRNGFRYVIATILIVLTLGLVKTLGLAILQISVILITTFITTSISNSITKAKYENRDKPKRESVPLISDELKLAYVFVFGVILIMFVVSQFNNSKKEDYIPPIQKGYNDGDYFQDDDIN
jgi:hypothetical protein